MAILIAIFILLFLPLSQPLQSSQVLTLLRIQKLLEFPKALDSLNNATHFCSLPPSSSLIIVCNENAISQLFITGDKSLSSALYEKNDDFSVSNQTLSQAFSAESLFTTLTKLYSLKSASLVSLGIWGPISSKLDRLSSLEVLNLTSNFLYGTIPNQLSQLRNMKTLILDDNILNGSVPEWFSALPSLEFLSLKNNKLSGSVPHSFSSMEALRILKLSANNLHGNLPDFSTMTGLQVLDLGNNAVGPDFPTLGKGLVTVNLSKNRFRSHIPLCLKALNHLKYFDVSFNALTGTPPSFLFSLPSITHLNLANNLLRGTIPENVSCSHSLRFVDLSANLLTGRLPSCLLAVSDEKTVNFEGNCLVTTTSKQPQNRFSHCQMALVSNKSPRKGKKCNLIGIMGIVASVVAALLLVAFVVWLFIIRARYKKSIKKNQAGKQVPEIASTGISSELLVNGRYISQGMKLGAHGLPQYRPFALEDLEEATNNFEQSALMGEGSYGKLYRGKMEDGTLVAIRCLKLDWKPTAQTLKLHMELFSKLRHYNLVSVLGHCIDSDLDGSNIKRVFLIFEYVSNGTLQSHLSGATQEECLTWPQRLTAVSGVARAIQFLHTGVVPGVFNNNLKITNVLLDQNRIAKVSDYGLPGLTTDVIEFEAKAESYKFTQKEAIFVNRKKMTDKTDIYNFGLILLETIVGRLPTQEVSKVDEMVNLISDQDTRRNNIDPAIVNTCVEESLGIVLAIAAKCLSKELISRPSIEDVLWNLQYAAQVQATTASELQSEESL